MMTTSRTSADLRAYMGSVRVTNEELRERVETLKAELQAMDPADPLYNARQGRLDTMRIALRGF